MRDSKHKIKYQRFKNEDTYNTTLSKYGTEYTLSLKKFKKNHSDLLHLIDNSIAKLKDVNGNFVANKQLYDVYQSFGRYWEHNREMSNLPCMDSFDSLEQTCEVGWICMRGYKRHCGKEFF